MVEQREGTFEPKVGDIAMVCDGMPGIKSGTIIQWDTEQDVFTIIEEVTLEEEQYLISGYTFHFNVKGGMWFIDVK